MTALACLACFAARACVLRLRLASKDELDDFEKEMKGAKAEDGAEQRRVRRAITLHCIVSSLPIGRTPSQH